MIVAAQEQKTAKNESRRDAGKTINPYLGLCVRAGEKNKVYGALSEIVTKSTNLSSITSEQAILNGGAKNLKKAKRILSFLMAIVIMSSFLSVAASAKADYKDAAIPASQYDDHDRPSFTIDQCSSMTLDFLDKMLKDMNDADGSLIIEVPAIGSLNLSSIDNALNSIYGLTSGSLWATAQGLLGDLGGLNFTAINAPRRTSAPAATADKNVIYALVQFLSDNKKIISMVIDGSLDMGLVNSFVDLSDIDINKMVKEMLFEQAYPDVDPVPEDITQTADQMIQDLVTGLIVGTPEEPGIAPGLAGYINIVNSTDPAYDFMEDLLANVYNVVLVPLLNTDLKKVVRELCGVVYDPLNPEDTGDESNLNEYALLLDIDYTVPVHTFAVGTTFVSELNDILFEIIDAITLNYNGWVAGDNSHALNNLTQATKYILGIIGGGLFEEYVETATQLEIAEMNYQELFSYLLRSLLNGSVDNMNIPSDADSLLEVAWYAAKEACAQYIPQNDYSAQPKTLDGVLFMLADFGVYSLNQVIDMNPATGSLPGQGLLAYGQGLDALVLALVNYVNTNYGGLLNLTLSTTNGWEALDIILFSIIPANWLPADIGGSTKELLVNRVLRDILELNTANLFALFDHRADSELASKTIKKILIDTVARLLNVVFPGTLKTTYTTFDQIIENVELKGIVERLLTALYNRRVPILTAILPLVTNLMGISSSQEFANPELSIPNQIGSAITFPINNESMGLNTGATDKSGAFTQDALYKIKIVDISTNIPAITPTNLVGVEINGGESVNCTLSGTFAEGGRLVVTMLYDVYTELGTKLTNTPLTVMEFSYVTNSVDDGRSYITYDANPNNKHISYYKSIYINQNASLSNIADAEVQFRRNTDGAHELNATISRTAATVNPALVGVTPAAFENISTNKDGGIWNVPVYDVDPAAVRPADGAYSSTFTYKATKTSSSGPDETWSYLNKSYVVFYDDFGLPALFNSELNKRRDPANYDDPFAWEDYMMAMEGAASVVYKPRQATSFMGEVMSYEFLKEDLEWAIEDLEATELATGVTTIKNAMEAVKPSNEGLEYDDPAYSYFGVADYVPYTYLNYEREQDNCSRLWNSQQLPIEPVLPADPTPEQTAAFELAHAQWVLDYAQAQENMVALKSVDISYALHRLTLYASRMIRVQAVKDRLGEAITAAGNPIEGQYTTMSWAAFEKAHNFATAVNAQSATATDGDGEFILRQTKVDTAREELIEATKKLVRVADYTQLLAELADAATKVQVEYTPATWSVFADALADAVAVPLQMSNTQENQTIIDTAAAALHNAIAGLVIAEVEIILEALDPNVVIGLPGLPNLLAGLGVGVGAHGYVSASTGGTLVFNDGANGPGTGSTVDLFDGAEIIDTFTVVIYGDVNGDANIDSQDAGVAVDRENYLVTWNPTTQASFLNAGDVNGDGNIDSLDAGLMLECETYMVSIDQTTGLAQPN